MSQSDEQELARLLADNRLQGGSRGPQPIAEILSRLMARRGYANEQMVQEWSRVWTVVAGKQASHSRTGKYSRGVLEVVVRNSIILQEMTFQKKQLLQAVQAQVPHVQIRDLRFRVGDLG